MIKIAITGIIASGKTFIASIIESLGYDIFYSDRFVGSLYEDKEFIKKLHALFPDIGPISKTKIATKIFDNNLDREKLEALIHPYVKSAWSDFIYKKQRESRNIIFAEIPLLFETGMDKEFDFVITITCIEDIREKRALERVGMTKELYLKIKNLQLPEEDKIKASDFVLQSTKSKLDLEEEIKQILKGLKKK